MRRTGFVFSGVFLVVGCVGELEGTESDYVVERSTGGDSGDSGASCAVEVIFAEKCASSVCHDSTSPQAGLDLSVAALETALVGVASSDSDCSDRILIDPSDIENSFLLEKLESNTPECGDPMPYGSILPPDQIACVRQWVVSLGSGGPPPGDAGGSVSTNDSGTSVSGNSQ
jgi:hypothetical protein